MRTPEDTLGALDELHTLFSKIAHRLILEYAGGEKFVKNARDQAEGAEQVIYIFHRAVKQRHQDRFPLRTTLVTCRRDT